MRMVLCGRYIKWGYNRAASRSSCKLWYIVVLAKGMETTHFPYYTIVKKYVVAKMEAGWSHKKKDQKRIMTLFQFCRRLLVSATMASMEESPLEEAVLAFFLLSIFGTQSLDMRQAKTVMTILCLTSTTSSGKAYTRAPIRRAMERAYLALARSS